MTEPAPPTGPQISRCSYCHAEIDEPHAGWCPVRNYERVQKVAPTTLLIYAAAAALIGIAAAWYSCDDTAPEPQTQEQPAPPPPAP